MSNPPPRRTSSLTEIDVRLSAINEKLDSIIRALEASADETSGNHQERVRFVQDVESLKRWRKDVEDLIRELLDRVARLEAMQRQGSGT